MATWITYAGLTRQEFSNPTSIAWRRQPAIHCLHSTEGNGYPSAGTYANGRQAPHFTIDMWARTARQHYPLTEGAWALQAPTGISTNSMGVIQYEIIGTCAGTKGVRSIFDAGDDELTYLAGLLRAVSDATGIPLASSVRWLAYPSSYGNAQGQRLSTTAFYAYRGVLGHQHIPGNTHGDPGNLDVARVLDLARGGTPAPLQPEEDIVVTREQNQADITAIVKAQVDRAIASILPRSMAFQIAGTHAWWRPVMGMRQWVTGEMNGPGRFEAIALPATDDFWKRPVLPDGNGDLVHGEMYRATDGALYVLDEGRLTKVGPQTQAWLTAKGAQVLDVAATNLLWTLPHGGERN